MIRLVSVGRGRWRRCVITSCAYRRRRRLGGVDIRSKGLLTTAHAQTPPDRRGLYNGHKTVVVVVRPKTRYVRRVPCSSVVVSRVGGDD